MEGRPKHENISSSISTSRSITTTSTTDAAQVPQATPVATTTITTTNNVKTQISSSSSTPGPHPQSSPGVHTPRHHASTTSAAPSSAPLSLSSSPVPPPYQMAPASSISGAAVTTAVTTALAVSSTSSSVPSAFAPATAATSGTSTLAVPSTSSGSTNKGISHRPAVFDKLEQLVRDMQDSEHGVPVRSQKLFITTIPAAFMGYDLIEWLMDRLSIEDSLEAVHLANLLCQFGYYFPIQDLKNLIVKDDSSLYRFQTPYYWPSQHHTPDNIEYAIYLAKRSQRNKQKHALEDYEIEAYNNLKKILTSKWDFVMMQAEEQLKLNKDRKKGDKIVTDSQEKAYWRVYRPPPGFTTVVESSPVPTREQRVKARSRTREHLTEELEFLKNYIVMARSRVSQVAENILEYTEDYMEFDAMLNPNSVAPSNPWITDDQSYWLLNQPLVECPTEKRVRKWAMSLENLISDPQGVVELMTYLKREYSHENLRFWLAVQELRTGPEAKIKKKVKEIWDEFLSQGAKSEINIDGKTMEATKQALKNPSRYTYEVAADHVYTLLLKKDCYPRFIRSDHYKALSANSVNPGNQKKRFPFPFAVKKKGPASQNPAGGTSQPVTNSRAGLESCNIYGADGTEDVNASEVPTRSSAARVLSCDPVDDNTVCPWDTGPADDAVAPPSSEVTKRRHHYSASQVGEKDTKPLAGKHDRMLTGSASAGAPQDIGNTNDSANQQHQAPQDLVRDSSRSSSRRAGSEGQPHHHHRHHDHHHHHHHSASKRQKSRSKRKKSSKGITRPTSISGGVATATISTSTAASGPDKENISGGTAEALVAGISSAAATTVGVASASAATGPEGAPMAAFPSTTTTSRCTQTKLEPMNVQVPAGVPVEAADASPLEGVLQQASSHGSTTRDRQLREWKSVEEVDSAPQTGVVPKKLSPSESPRVNTTSTTVHGEFAMGASGGAEEGAKDKSKMWSGERSSTEVCPWEDEDNSKESHAPFVKTYATLGYL